MPITIKQAQTSKQLIDIMEHRYFCHHNEHGRSVDALDILPSTLNVLAYENNKILGTIRAIQYDPLDKNQKGSYDFSESSQKLVGSTGLIDVVSVSLSQSLFPVVYEYLVKMSVFLMSLRGYKFVFHYAPREVSNRLVQMGFTPLTQDQSQDKQVPMILKIEDFTKKFDAIFADKEILRFKEVFYYTIFTAGEVMVTEGERGNTAYVAENGGVEVLIQSNEELVPISQIPTGVLIGEVAMITNEPRTASLICHEDTACISFDRGEFFRIMYSEPHRTVEIFKILSRRLSASNKKIAELSKG